MYWIRSANCVGNKQPMPWKSWLKSQPLLQKFDSDNRRCSNAKTIARLLLFLCLNRIYLTVNLINFHAWTFPWENNAAVDGGGCSFKKQAVGPFLSKKSSPKQRSQCGILLGVNGRLFSEKIFLVSKRPSLLRIMPRYTPCVNSPLVS